MQGKKTNDGATVSVSNASDTPQNAADTLLEIIRDCVHAHLNTAVRIGDMVIPKSLSTILLHDAPEYREGRNLADICNSLMDRVQRTVHGGNVVGKATESAASYSVQFVVPGWDRDDLEMLVNAHRITVKGRKADSRGHLRMMTLGTWESPEALDPSNATAKIGKGVLEATVYKAEDARASSVEIDAV